MNIRPFVSVKRTHERWTKNGRVWDVYWSWLTDWAIVYEGNKILGDMSRYTLVNNGWIKE